MAEENDDADKRDEEQEVSDNDADTRDTEEAEKRDEEQTVRDTDADTASVDSRLDALESMVQRMSGKLDKIVDAQSVLVESGAIIDSADDPSDDDGIEPPSAEDVLDLRIND